MFSMCAAAADGGATSQSFVPFWLWDYVQDRPSVPADEPVSYQAGHSQGEGTRFPPNFHSQELSVLLSVEEAVLILSVVKVELRRIHWHRH